MVDLSTSMHQIRNNLSVVIFIGVFIPCLGVTQKSDSIQQLLSSTGNDSLRIHYLMQLGQMSITNDSATAYRYFKQAIELQPETTRKSKTIKVLWEMGKAYSYAACYEKSINCLNHAYKLSLTGKDTSSIIRSLNGMGIVSWQQGDYYTSIKHYKKSLKYSKNTGDKEMICASCNGLGVVYLQMSEHEKAMNYFIKANRISKEIGNIQEIANTTGNIAIIYSEMKRYREAIKAYKTAVGYWSQIHDKHAVATGMHNIGINFLDLKLTDSAEYYARKSLNERERLKDKRGVSHSLRLIGEIEKESGNYESSLKNYQKALDIQREIKDVIGVSTTLLLKGSLLTLMNIHDSAEYCLNESFKLARKIDDKSLILSAYQYYAELYAKQEKYEQAYQYQKLYQQLKDSIYSSESNRNVMQMHIRYGSEIKDKQLKALSGKIRHYEKLLSENKQTIYYISGLISFLLIFFLIIFNTYRLNQNLLLEKNENKDRPSFFALKIHYPYLQASYLDIFLTTCYAVPLLFILKPLVIDTLEKYMIWYILLYTFLIFLIILVNNKIIQKMMPDTFNKSTWTSWKELIFIHWNILSAGLFITLISGVLMPGKIKISYISNHISLAYGFALIPLLIRMYNSYNEGMKQVYKNTVSLINRRVRYFKDQENDEKTIKFISDKSSQQKILRKDDLLFIHSDNIYIEIYYKIDQNVRKELLRNSLKNIENILIEHPEFCRCHRSYIVNLKNVDRVKNRQYKYFLTFNNIDEEVPISRTLTKEIMKVLTYNNNVVNIKRISN